ncbi:MAG: F0F1 ATP synthase subunit A [Armatimonadia bacterium]|nr:F0F1 ATP synthase subunit A [Armatimonadia bacterium]
MRLTPDQLVIFETAGMPINATLVFSWALMLLMVVGSWLVTRRITSDVEISQGQNLLEVIVTGIRDQIRDMGVQRPELYLPFIGTLFLFIALANIFAALVPGFEAPTGSLSTTAALALVVFVAVPVFGIAQQGLRGYLRQYIEPTPLMLPMNVIGELSRTLALAFRLFGNIMSGALIVGLLLALAPFFFPIVMRLLGLLTGLVQAYIFAVLAMVYIASATRGRTPADESEQAAEAG